MAISQNGARTGCDASRFGKAAVNPRLEINCEKIRHNVQAINAICSNIGIRVMGITKGFSAIPQVARAMLKGGLQSLGDSRLQNIIALRRAGINAEMTMIRIPMLKEVEHVVVNTAGSINSEIEVIRALADTAVKLGKIHHIILMIEMGDLREGVRPCDVGPLAGQVHRLKGVRLTGLAANFNCLSGVIPTVEKLAELGELANEIESRYAIRLQWVSGGSSTTLRLILNGRVHNRINHLRIGEAIMLGHIDQFEKIEGLYPDAFMLKSDIVELKEKPSIPEGKLGRDSFGNVPTFKNCGLRQRAVLAVGKQDVFPQDLAPTDPGVHIIGASSDLLVVDVTDAKTRYKLGDEIGFLLSYPGILSATTSKYIRISCH